MTPIAFTYDGIERRGRNLPHWTKDGVTYWITFRLGDSLPQDKLKRWDAERNFWLATNPEPWSDTQWEEYNRRFGLRFHEWLDAGAGTCVLGKKEVREVVRACLTRFDHERYLLRAAVIMPNHVHMLLEMTNEQSLSAILKGMKGASARSANLMLGKTGAFWAVESYDHIVRSEAQLHYLANYIETNPVKARLLPEKYWLKQIEYG